MCFFRTYLCLRVFVVKSKGYKVAVLTHVYYVGVVTWGRKIEEIYFLCTLQGVFHSPVLIRDKEKNWKKRRQMNLF